MDSASTLATAKAEVFGADPALGTDGQPLERGVGSVWHRADQIAKAHYHAAEAWAACDQMIVLAKQLTALAEKVTAAAKASIEAAQAAKAEVPQLPVISVPEPVVAVQVPAVPPEPVTLDFKLPAAQPPGA